MRLPRLPKLLANKLYKTGQTRGADDDMIYQNRVLRNSTVLIPFEMLLNTQCVLTTTFENGFIVLISPDHYFGATSLNTQKIMLDKGLILGINALVYYTQRQEYLNYPPTPLGLSSSEPFSRTAPLGGDFVARISATTSESRISFGYNVTSSKGAGIRLYEYASSQTIDFSRLQLESLYWLCEDSIDASIYNGMSIADAEYRKNKVLQQATSENLLNIEQMKSLRFINKECFTVCPLCLKKLSAYGFYQKVEQQQFRQVHDLTITEINLFHIVELRDWEFNHQPYNLSWGHHHCNVVVKDNGISPTIEWMRDVVNRNDLL